MSETMAIELAEGEVTLVDADDYESLTRHKWQLSMTPQGRMYVQRSQKVNGRVRTVMMHRQIMNASKGMDVDHINGDGLDNRRCNLRVVEHWRNLHNTGKPVTNTTGFKGVHYFAPTDRWVATIGIRGRTRCLGYYATKEGAARAYDAAARRMVGDCAGTNFEGEPEPELTF